MKKNKKKTKKTRGFLRFWIFQKLAKNRPFWWPPAGNEKKTKKTRGFYVFLIFPKFAKRRAGNHQRRKKRK